MAVGLGTAIGYLDLDIKGFAKGIDSAMSDMNKLGKSSSSTSQKIQTAGSKISKTGSIITKGLTAPIVGATAASVKFGAGFDKQMAKVKSVSGASTAEFNKMRDAAISWGEKTVYTAAEAADALYYMGLAGWSAEESINALGPVLNLAAAGDLELGRASDIVTDAMTAMKLSAGDLNENGIENTIHFTNALAAAMSNSNTDVDQMGEAFKYVAPLAGSLGYSIDDLSLALGLMANVGVKSSQAGTGLRQALKNLVSPTDKASIVMDKYGLSLYDSEGKAKSLGTFMQELRTIFGDVGISTEELETFIENLNLDLSTEEGQVAASQAVMEHYGQTLPISQQEKLNDIVQIFGTRALPGVLGIIEASEEDFNSLKDSIDNSDAAFVRHEGHVYAMEDALKKFGDTVYTDDSFEILGAAAGIAETQMDNLWGDFTKLTSALGATQIIISDIVKGELREFVQKLTELVQWFNNLDEGQQKNIVKFALFVATIGPVLIVVGKLMSTISLLVDILGKLKSAFGLAAKAPGLLVKALGLITAHPVVAAITAIIVVVVLLYNKCEWFRNGVKKIWNGIKEGLGTVKEKVQGLFGKDIPTTIGNCLDFIRKLPKEVAKLGLEFIKGFINGVTGVDVEKEVKKLFKKVIKGVKDLFGIKSPSKVMSDIGDYVVQGFVKGVKGLQNAVKNVFDTMKKPFKNIKPTFEGIGKDTVGGIVKGIGDNAYGLYESVKNTMSGMVTRAKNALGIQSPSKVFANEVGKWLPPGILKGFEDAMPKATKDIENNLNDSLDDIEVKDIKTKDINIDTQIERFIDKYKDMFEGLVTWYDTMEERLYTSVKNMRDNLEYLENVGKIVNQSGSGIGGTIISGDKSKATISKDKESNDSKTDSPSTSSGDVFNFYNIKSDPYEYYREMKKAKEELLYGF